MIGILPTLAEGHMTSARISANPRYKLLSEQILDARGEDITITSPGVERLETTADSIVPEAACTSTQFHVQTSPDEFAAYWNASQAIAGVQLAVGANSPYLLGKELWRETRIPLFEQATDTRSEELKAQGVRPRVWFGERWITSVFDLFEENVRYFPALLPDHRRRGPARGARGRRHARRSPSSGCTTARSTAGTGRSTTSPDGVPHLRVENRLLAAGPTVADTIANAAFYFGLVRALAESERPLWSQMSFSAAEENFHVAAQHGIDAQIYWPGIGQVRATELVLRRLLPMAHEGLDAWGVEPDERDRLLGIIEQRCLLGHQRRRVVRRPHAAARRDGPLRRAARHAAGLPRADAHQRARAHLELSRPALSGRSRRQVRDRDEGWCSQPLRVTSTNPGTSAALGARRRHRPRARRGRRRAQLQVARPGQPQRPGRGCDSSARLPRATATSTRVCAVEHLARARDRSAPPARPAPRPTGVVPGGRGRSGPSGRGRRRAGRVHGHGAGARASGTAPTLPQPDALRAPTSPQGPHSAVYWVACASGPHRGARTGPDRARAEGATHGYRRCGIRAQA